MAALRRYDVFVKGPLIPMAAFFVQRQINGFRCLHGHILAVCANDDFRFSCSFQIA